MRSRARVMRAFGDCGEHCERIGMRSTLVFFLVVSVLFLTGCPRKEESGIVYVKVGKAGTEDGRSWGTAFNSLQEGVDRASQIIAEGSVDAAEVWVAEGTYTSTTDPVVAMKPGVFLYGGFIGGETNRAQRDVTGHRATVDGEGARRCVEGANTATLDGLIITHGIAQYGGGMYNNAVSPTVANCMFVDNCILDEYEFSFGGGMCNVSAASPAVTNCVFIDNEAVSGGAMYNATAAFPVVTSCVFSGNKASYGGGMANKFDALTRLTNCIFAGNTAYSGGAMHNQDKSAPGVINCTFTENIALHGGAMTNESNSSPTITNCVFWGNTGDQIYNIGSSISVTYSCVEKGYEGVGNISSDPLIAGLPGRNGRIQPDSPCIDAGTSNGAPSADMRGVNRPQGQGVDMGAYELDDLDGDGLSDRWEQTYLDGLSAQANMDPDGDGLTNIEEASYGSDPREADSDGDGLADGEEIEQSWDPMTKTVVRRVSLANASGVQDGTTWASAYVSIQAALRAVKSSGEGEVWVAAGIYRSTAGSVVDMKRDVHLYGGFAGTETIRDTRDLEANPTVLDGEGVRRCVSGANEATLDGFVVRNGKSAIGGGMYNYCSSPAVANCTFSGNMATGFYGGSGGGMYNNEVSSPDVFSCVFTGNTAGSGGGVYNDEMSSAMFANCLFTENTGTAVHNAFASSTTLTHCTFSGNSAHKGAGIFNISASPTVMGCTFIGNTASHGGGMYNTEEKVVAVDIPPPLITNCTFIGNTAVDFYGGRGAGIYNDVCAPTLTNCTFSGNAAEYGGAIYNYYSQAPMSNCVLWGNLSSQLYNEHVSPSVTFSCIEGGYEGLGNTSEDPLFVDVAQNDLRLQAGSPCIDTGTAINAPDLDIEGTIRPQGAGFDMGAYERLSGV